MDSFKKTLLLFSLVFGFLSARSALAVCPVCTVAVCAGVGFSRWLGIDDLISGVWVGGLVVSFIFWTLDWLGKKKIVFKLRWLAVSVAFYALVIIPLYLKGIIGHPANTFWGMDKLLLGIITGSLFFLFSVWFHGFLKTKNQGKSYFPYQKVAVPIIFLLIASLIFYLLTKCLI